MEYGNFMDGDLGLDPGGPGEIDQDAIRRAMEARAAMQEPAVEEPVTQAQPPAEQPVVEEQAPAEQPVVQAQPQEQAAAPTDEQLAAQDAAKQGAQAQAPAQQVQEKPPAVAVEEMRPLPKDATQALQQDREGLRSAQQEQLKHQEAVDEVVARHEEKKTAAWEEATRQAQELERKNQADQAIRQSVTDKLATEQEAMRLKLQNESVDRNRLWNNQTTGQKVSRVFSMILGSFGDGDKNAGVEAVQRLIDQDIAGQKETIAKHEKDYERGREALTDRRQEDERQRLRDAERVKLIWDSLDKQLALTEQQTKSESIRESAAATRAIIQQKQAEATQNADNLWSQAADRQANQEINRYNAKTARGHLAESIRHNKMAEGIETAKIEGELAAKDAANAGKAEKGIIYSPGDGKPIGRVSSGDETTTRAVQNKLAAYAKVKNLTDRLSKAPGYLSAGSVEKKDLEKDLDALATNIAIMNNNEGKLSDADFRIAREQVGSLNWAAGYNAKMLASKFGMPGVDPRVGWQKLGEQMDEKIRADLLAQVGSDNLVSDAMDRLTTNQAVARKEQAQKATAQSLGGRAVDPLEERKRRAAQAMRSAR